MTGLLQRVVRPKTERKTKMKNLAHIDEDKLDLMPTRRAMHRHNADAQKSCRCSYCDERGRDWFPYDRINRWLASRVGRNWDKVVQEYTHLDWVPVLKRRASELSKFVETHTFMDGKKVMFYDSCSRCGESAVEVGKSYQEIFYVHPKTKVLSFKRRTSKDDYYAKRQQERTTWFISLGDYNQLIKLDGIWYHVWADALSFPHMSHYSPTQPLIYEKERMRKEFMSPFDPRWYDYLYHRPKVYKQQLGWKTLNYYGLVNDHKMPVYNICKVCGGDNCGIHSVEHGVTGMYD